jgi:hypothetical protein
MSTRWWNAPKNASHGLLVAQAQNIYEQSATWRERLRYFLDLYDDTPLTGGTEIGAYKSSRKQVLHFRLRNRNVFKAIVNTAISDASQTTDRVLFVTSGASQALQKQAKARQAFCDGEFDRLRYKEFKHTLIQHACLYGTGILKVHRKGNFPCIEHVDPWNLMVSDNEGKYGSPQQIFERRVMLKAVLAARFPKLKDQIALAPGPRDPDSDQYSDSFEFCEVWTATRLPSEPEAKDGRQVICVGTTTLQDTRWERDYFPYVVLRWRRRPHGFWGDGIGDDIATCQEVVRKDEADIEAAHFNHAHARFWAPLPQEGETGAYQINNAPGTINYYDPSKGAGPPSLQAGNILSPEIYNDRDSTISAMFMLSGVPQSLVRNEKPEGLNSGKALRLWSDLSGKPLLPFFEQCELVDVEVARRLLDAAKDIYGDTGKYSTIATEDDGIVEIDFKDIGDLDERKIRIKAYSVKGLDKTPSGRLEEVQELAGTGLGDKLGFRASDYVDLLGFPDVKAKTSYRIAPTKLYESIVEKILENGWNARYAPDPAWIGPEEAFAIGGYKLAQAMLREDVPDDHIEDLRQWLVQVQRVMELKNGPPPEEDPNAPPVDPNAGALQGPDLSGVGGAPVDPLKGNFYQGL